MIDPTTAPLTGAETGAVEASPRHALNNLFAKIMGSAELALDRASDPVVRAELEAILDLTEAAAALANAHVAQPQQRQVGCSAKFFGNFSRFAVD
jgi:hypothetical protein